MIGPASVEVYVGSEPVPAPRGMNPDGSCVSDELEAEHQRRLAVARSYGVEI